MIVVVTDGPTDVEFEKFTLTLSSMIWTEFVS